jgi:sugar lactone lactonase YvrE
MAGRSTRRRRTVALIALCVVIAGCGGNAAPSTPTASGSASSEPTTDVSLAAPEDVAFDASGVLYVSEFEGNRIDRIDDASTLQVVAGTGSSGYAGDGGPAIDAELSAPTGMAFDAAGNLFLADHHNGCIREVDTADIIDRLWGVCGTLGFEGDGGPALDARLNDPIGIAIDGDGRLWIADELNGRIRRVNVDGSIETVAGGGIVKPAIASDGTTATKLRLSHPSYLAIDGSGNVYFSDFLENVVMRIDASGGATRVAGTGKAGYGGDGGPATKAELNLPTGLALDANGNLYISDAGNNRIRMVGVDGVISTVAGSGEPGGAGEGGPAVDAQLQAPAGLAFDPSGRLVIADQGNNLVRMVDGTGVITTIAGVAP